MTVSEPAASTPIATPPARRPAWVAGLLVFGVACIVFGVRLGAEPHFVDESAYLTQSFYADLLIEGRVDDPAWLDYGGYDLPPLPKYLVGLALRLAGYPRPGPSEPARWYDNTSYRPTSDGALVAARVPSVILGAVGCVAFYAIGRRALGAPAGLLAAGLLMIDPLYRLHARRAMSDVPAESFMLVALAFGLAAWSRWAAGKGGWRAGALLTIGAGTFTGLAVLSKLNGSIAGMVLGAWAVLGIVDPRASARSKVELGLATVASGLVAFVVFVALNPFLTARPSNPSRLPPQIRGAAQASFLDRVLAIAIHRVGVSERGQRSFPADALTTLPAKVAAVAIQGYGRFSPLGPSHADSRIRFDRRQDWGVVAWLPLVIVGLVVAVRRGRSQREAGEPATAWAVVAMALVALIAVTSFIPLAWDRYYLSIQPGAILLASAALAAPFGRLGRTGRVS